jgi:hypothetical protein
MAFFRAFWACYILSAMSAEISSQEKLVPRNVLNVWWIFCVIASLLWVTCAMVHRHGYDPLAKPLLDSPLTDITVYAQRFELYRTPAFFEKSSDPKVSTFAYPPAAALIYYFFYKIIPHSRYLYVGLSALVSLVTIGSLWLLGVRFLRSPFRSGLFIATSLLFSFPFLFLIQRGNIELIVWSVIAIGILAYFRGALYLAAVLFGIAASVKLYPVLLLGLFLSRRKIAYGPFLAGLASCAVVTLFALWFSGPSLGYAAHGFAAGVAGFQGGYVKQIRFTEIGFDHSLFSPIKLLAIGHNVSPASLTRPYYLIAGLLMAAVFFLRVRTLPSLNQLVFLVTAMILFPPVSYEYTFVHLYLPLLLLLATFVGYRGESATSASSVALGALVCMLILLLPVDLLGKAPVFFAGQLQVVPLLFLLGFAVAAPWTSEAAAVTPVSL